MYRDILTNKWVLGGIGFLIVLSVACVLWYQHDTADERKAAADAEELLRQSEAAKKVSDTDGETEQAADVAPAESKTPTAEKLRITEINSEVMEDTDAEAQIQQSETPAENTEGENVAVSPFGFGPYPEVPEDYPTNVIWNLPGAKENLPDHALKGIELLDRVLVKLWIEGDKNFRGGCTDNGKVYPYYHNTVYVRYAQQEMPDGTIRRYFTSAKSGYNVEFDEEDLLSDTPPAHLRIIELDSTGIDPYQFLNLP